MQRQAVDDLVCVVTERLLSVVSVSQLSSILAPKRDEPALDVMHIATLSLQRYKARAAEAFGKLGLAGVADDRVALTHQAAITTRLQLVSAAVRCGSAMVSYDTLLPLWREHVVGALTPAESEAFFAWFCSTWDFLTSSAASPVAVAAFDVSCCFHRLFLPPEMFPPARVGPCAFIAFEAVLRKTNTIEGRFLAGAGVVVQHAAVTGSDVLWDIFALVRVA